jgi:hypothetical protein
MFGPEREEMLDVVDNDKDLDDFLIRLDKTRKAEMNRTARPASRGITKDQYIAQQTRN